MRSRKHWHPKPHPMPYLYGTFYPDTRHEWLDDPWFHVALIVALLGVAGILIFVLFPGGPA